MYGILRVNILCTTEQIIYLVKQQSVTSWNVLIIFNVALSLFYGFPMTYGRQMIILILFTIVRLHYCISPGYGVERMCGQYCEVPAIRCGSTGDSETAPERVATF